MTAKKTFDMKYILDNLMNDPAVSAAIKKLQENIAELSIAITQKITYDIMQSTVITIPEKKEPVQEQTKTHSPHKQITDWANATDTQLRAARLNRRRDGHPLEPDLIAELQKRFSNYDSKTDRFTSKKYHRTKEYWIKKSDAALYSALRERRTRGYDIEPELSAALTERFPTFNPEIKKIIRRSTKNTDWANATNIQLKVARQNRRRDGHPLEPDLIAELQKRFSNYDAKTDTFSTTEIDWSKQSKKSLQTAINYRKRTGQPIPAEMATALEQKSTPKKKTTRTNWSNASNQNLRMAYYYRIARKLPIEPSLNDALAAAFPGYDATTQAFVGKNNTTQKQSILQNTTPETPERLFPLYSIPTTSGNYALSFNNNKTNSNLLIGAKQPYEVCLIDTKTKMTVIRKALDDIKFTLYIINYATGEIISETKPGMAIILYSAKTHELYAQKHRDNLVPTWHISPDKNITKIITTPKNISKILAAQIKKETILIEENGRTSTHPLLTLGSQDKNDAQNATITQMLHAAPERIIETETKPNTQHAALPVVQNTQQTENSTNKSERKKQNSEIPVYIEHVKSNLMGSYNNVYINGKKVLSNHFDTKVKLLLDDTLLGIHGIVTDNKDLPQTPIWIIYDTTLKSRINPHMEKFSGYQVHAKKILETSDGLRLDLSNRCIALLKRDRIKAQADNKRFVISTVKTK